MHIRPVREGIRNTLLDFNSSWFKKVRVWNPESIVENDFKLTNLPMAGVDVFASLAEYDEPQSTVEYGIMIYVMVHKTKYTTGLEDEKHEDMMCDLSQHIWGSIYKRFAKNRDIGDSTNNEIILKTRMNRWKYRGESDVFRRALEYLQSDYYGAWFNVVVTTKITNPTY